MIKPVIKQGAVFQSSFESSVVVETRIMYWKPMHVIVENILYVAVTASPAFSYTNSLLLKLIATRNIS